MMTVGELHGHGFAERRHRSSFHFLMESGRSLAGSVESVACLSRGASDARFDFWAHLGALLLELLGNAISSSMSSTSRLHTSSLSLTSGGMLLFFPAACLATTMPRTLWVQGTTQKFFYELISQKIARVSDEWLSVFYLFL